MSARAMLMLMLVAGCSSRSVAIDSAAPIPDRRSLAEGPSTTRPDVRPALPDLPDLPVKGRVILRELTDPRINTVLKPIATAEFTDTRFYDAMFVAASIHGECAIGQVVPPPPAVPHWIDAGPVLVKGGDVPLVTLSFQSDSTYKNDLPSSTYSIFSDGQTLGLSSLGSGAVPGFGETLSAPAGLKISMPDLLQMTTRVSTASSFAVQWTAGSATLVRVKLTCPTSVDAVYCDSSDNGELVIPQAALAQLATKCREPHFTIERVNQANVVVVLKAAIAVSAAVEVRGGVTLE